MSLVRGTHCEMEDAYKEQYSELFVSLEDVEKSYVYLGVTENAGYTDFETPVDRLTDMFEMYTNPGMPRGL